MAIFETLSIEWGIALLLAMAFAEYAKFRKKAERGWDWIGVAAVFFLFAGVFPGFIANVIPIGEYGTWEIIFEAIGWILALIGTFFIAYEVLLGK